MAQITKPTVGATGWNTATDALIDQHNALDGEGGAATVDELAAHAADTTSVHGITDTATLVVSATLGGYARKFRAYDFDFTRGAGLLMDEPPSVTVFGVTGLPTDITDPVVIDVKTSDQVRRAGAAAARFEAVSTNFLGTFVGLTAQPYALHWVTDAVRMEVVHQGSATPKFRLWVDGRRQAAAVRQFTSGGGSTYRMEILNPDRQFREYRLECVTAFVSEIVVAETDTIYAPPPPAVSAVWLGDSWMEGPAYDNFGGVCSRVLGWEPTISALGGSGFLQATTYANRAQDYVIDAAPDAVVVVGGINDSNTGLQAAATSLLTTLRTALPDALLVVFGPQSASTASASSQSAKVTSLAAACAAVDGAVHVDPSGWITGSGTTAATTGDGNADLYTDDGVHPNDLGNYYVGSRLARAIAAAIDGL